MSMLRREWEADANDVLVKAAEAADLFEDAARRLPREAAILDVMAARRRRLAQGLDRALRAEGVLPKGVDPEHEEADRLLASVRSALSRDEETGLLNDRLAADRKLAASIAETLGDADLPPALKAVLEAAAGEIDADRAALEARLGGAA